MVSQNIVVFQSRFLRIARSAGQPVTFSAFPLTGLSSSSCQLGAIFKFVIPARCRPNHCLYLLANQIKVNQQIVQVI